jgi:thiamine-monophosphate kinase
MADTGFTPIADLGEMGLIDRITQGFGQPLGDQLLVGPGDDAAVLDLGNGRCQVVSKDLLLEGVHFDLAYCPLPHLGYKAVSVNVSDICAMNARPTGILVGLGISNRFPVEAVEAIYDGIRAACTAYGIALLGGDISASQQGLVISVTILGDGNQDTLTLRSGAAVDELLCVTGNVGSAMAGLHVLQREKQVYLQNPEVQPNLTGYEYVVERQLRPLARTDVVGYLADQGVVPTAMMDLSDGLSTAVNQLCQASGLGAAVYQEKLPIHPETVECARDFNQPATSFALYGGEDYELLLSIRPEDFDKIVSLMDIHPIGHFIPAAQGVQFVFTNGEITPLQPMGYQHFSA